MKRVLITSLLFTFLLCSCGISGSGGSTAAEVMAGEIPSETKEVPELMPLEEDENHTLASEQASPEAEEDSVGLMAFYPNGDGALSALAGMNTFTFYFDHPDVVVGNGRIGLYDAMADEDPLCSAVDVTDQSRCTILPIDENGVNISNFENGSMAQIRFDRPFEAGKSYYILMDNGCFKRGDIISTGIANASYITFKTKKYGVSGKLSREGAVGGTQKFKVLLGGEADAASMVEYNSSFLSFSSPSFSGEGGEEEIKFLRPTEEGLGASCTLAFYDSRGQRIDSCSFTFDISDEKRVDDFEGQAILLSVRAEDGGEPGAGYTAEFYDGGEVVSVKIVEDRHSTAGAGTTEVYKTVIKKSEYKLFSDFYAGVKEKGTGAAFEDEAVADLIKCIKNEQAGNMKNLVAGFLTDHPEFN